MNLESHELVFYGLAIGAVIAWLFALLFMLNTSRQRKSAAEQEQETLQLGTTPPDGMIAGSAEVAGAPAELSKRAAGLLAKQGPGTLYPVKIVEQTADRVVFEAMPAPVQHRSVGILFSRGDLRFTSVGQGKSRVDYALETPRRVWLLVMGWVFVGLGLLAIVVTFSMIQLYVLDALDPNVRWQAVQMVQAVHFIWPPFLFGGLYRRMRTNVRLGVETFVNNLPYVEG